MAAISSNLDLANQALCLLGEMTITALGSSGSKPSLFADRFVDQAIYETQSMADWRECIKRATITAGSAPTYGATATFSLPADCIRLLEVNASTSADDTLPFHLEGTKIVASAATIYIRYIAQTAIASCGPLLQQACAVRLAAKLALPLTGSQERLAAMESLFSKTIGEAMAKETAEHPLTKIALERVGVVPATLSPDTLRRIRTFADEARKEVLRRTYASEATALSSMDTLAQAAVHALHAAKIATALSLPSAPQFEELFQLRMREARLRALQTSALNGRVLAMIGADLASRDISDTALTEIATFADEARKEVNRMTYVSEATALGSMDTLAQECVDILHARKIATYLSLPQIETFENLFSKKILEAKNRALQTSALNGRVLAMIGADLLTKDISDTTLTELVTNLAADARKEVLRTGLFASAIELATLSSSAGALAGKTHSYALPTDCLALLELSSDSAGQTLLDYELIDQKIAVDGTPVYLRYIKDQTITDLDVLAQSAIDALHAAKIAHYLTLPSLSNHEELYQLRLRQARKAALDESDISTQVLALVGEDLLKAEINRHQIRWFRRYADEAREEVLRMHRWNCATARAELVQAAATVGTYPYTYDLPADCLRLLEVNGESYETGEALFEIEAGVLHTHATTVWIRYIADTPLTALDPLLQQAITLRHAAKIAAVTSIPSAPMLESMFQKRLAEARQANSHVRSADNNPRHRLASRSILLRSRGSFRNPLRLEDY